MKILYDYQILTLQKYGGISRYFYELIEGINKTNNRAKIKCIHSVNYYFRNMLKEHDEMKGRKWSFFYRINRLYNRIVSRGYYDIIHPTYYDNYILKAKSPKRKLVVTVYDMIHEKFEKEYPEKFRDTNDIAMKKRMIYESDHIIAISESTKRDILEIYRDIPEEKISVIYLGMSKNSLDGVCMENDVPNKYILFVGQRGAYKNFSTFVDAVNPILDTEKEIYVVCAGGGAFTDEEMNRMKENRSRFIQYNATDDLLTYLYNHALCFVFPSLYEGFGIPTLEAFSNNCPVVLSNTSSMPEVGGDAAIYFDPSDVEEMSSRIKEVIFSEVLRNKMIEKGKARLSLFEWDTIVGQTLECYKKVCSSLAK